MSVRIPIRHGLLFSALLVLCAATTSAASAQMATAARPNDLSSRQDGPLLVLEAIQIDPANPGPNTLCKLWVRIRNDGSQAATSFLFQVRLNGQELPVYKKNVYMQTIAPGETGEVQLYNFWTTDSQRPLPAGGRLAVEVTLDKARWVEIRTTGNATDHTFLDDVADLPVSLSLTKRL